MAINPTNITGQEVTWQPTIKLRWAGKKKKTADLEQLWVNRQTGVEEWREVEFIHEA